MKIHSSLKPTARELRALGYDLCLAKSGHIHIRLQGKFIYAMAGSPSDRRGALALRTDLKKRGVALT